MADSTSSTWASSLHQTERSSDSAWRRRFMQLFAQEDLLGTSQLESQPPRRVSTSNCASADCGVCWCAAASLRNGPAHIDALQLVQENVAQNTASFLQVHPLFPIVRPDDLERNRASLLRQCERPTPCVGGKDVYVIPTSSNNMVTLFALAIEALASHSSQSLQLPTCRFPGSAFFVAAMYMLHETCATDVSSLAVLQGNIAYIAICIYHNDLRAAEQALRLLRSAQDTYFENLSGMAEASQTSTEDSNWEPWLHYSVSILASYFDSTSGTQSIVWPAIETCLEAMRKEPVVGFALCTMKDLESLQDDSDDPQPELHVAEVHRQTRFLLGLRKNLLESLRWSDFDDPSDSVLHVLIRHRFYLTLFCVYYKVLHYFLQPRVSRERLNEHENATAIGLLDEAVQVAQRLIDVTQNLNCSFPLRHVHTQWFVNRFFPRCLALIFTPGCQFGDALSLYFVLCRPYQDSPI